MKKSIIALLLSCLITSCGILIPFPESKKFPTTTFYVKNNSDRTVNFKATVLKRNSMGPFEMTNSFTVNPKDSVLARQVGFKRDSENPQKWFTNFTIFPTDSIQIHDPNKPSNWKKWTNEKGKPCYTFIIAE